MIATVGASVARLVEASFAATLVGYPLVGSGESRF